MLTLLELQSHAGNKPLIFQVVCTQNGTAVQKGSSWGVCAEVRRPLFWKDNEMKTMLNLLHHKDDHNNNGDGSSSGNGNKKCKCRTRDLSAQRTAVILVVIDRRRVCRIGCSRVKARRCS